MAMHDYEGHADGCGHGEKNINPPEGPGEVDEPVSPVLAAENHHADDGCETEGQLVAMLLKRCDGRAILTCEPHWEAAEKQRLCWMRYHGPPYLGIHGIPCDGKTQEDGEQQYVKSEEDVADVLEPPGVVR